MYDSPLAEDKFSSPADHNDGEYIKLFNPTNQTVDLSGWVIKGTEQAEQFTIPVGTVIQAQGILLIAYISNGNFNFSDFYHLDNTVKVVNQSAIILYNNGEMVCLYDASANLVDAIGFGYLGKNSTTPVLFAHNGIGSPYNQLMSLHRTQVTYKNGLVSSLGNTDMTYALATPSAGGNAVVNNTTPLIPPAAPSMDLNQMAGQNYTITSVPLVAKTTSTLGARDELTTIQYFDGLGRPVETVQRAITPTSKDLVALTEYDAIGNEHRQWLPIAGIGNGAYLDPTAFTSNTTTLYGTDARPYATMNHEQSPLNRVTGKYGAGASWYDAQKNDSVLYQTNIANDVAYYYVENNLLKRNAEYAANSLYVTKVSDEDNKQTYEFKDKLGQVILKRSINDGQNINTYYVYNDLGQLSYVLPPLVADQLGTNTTTGYGDGNDWLTRYAYIYRYDERGNNVVKRLPGCDYINMVYDKADRLVLSQDGNQRIVNKWIVTKYDALGRVLYTGILNNTSTREQYKAILDNQVVIETYDGTTTFYNTGYTCTGSLTGITPLTVNYYDNYSFTSLATNGSNLNWIAPPTGYDSQYTNATGLLTGIRTYILDKTIISYLTTTMYYDDRGRVVQSHSTNQLGGYDISYNHYDFTGKILTARKEHSTSGKAVIPEVYSYTYDHAERLINTAYEMNNKPAVMLASNSYDELGRLSTKARHSQTDQANYAYNIRNWTTRIKSGPLFEEDLFYNTNPLNSSTCYNGNISYSTWTYNSVNKGYAYSYDGLNRLINATFKQGTSSQLNGSFDEIFAYDSQGNITSLKRKKDNVLLDDLVMNLPGSYNGNQLQFVNDNVVSQNLYTVKEYKNLSTATSDEFKYDANGNMTTDLDRKIVTIQYNILNLPDLIQSSNGNQIINRYAANGQKLGTEYFTRVTDLAVPLKATEVISQTYTENSVNQNGTVYIDDKEYNTYNGNPALTVLKRIYNAEGYAEDITFPIPNYYYFRKDHLGNNREVWCANNNATVQRTQYYPSGLPWASNTGDNPSLQERKYNGKEFVEMHGYDAYDYGARGYYPALGSFPTVDPLAESTPGISPYAYCYNNPVRYIDPLGMAGEDSGQKDFYGRNRFDTFTHMYIPPMDRPGGISASGYGDSKKGHFEQTKHTSETYGVENDPLSTGGLSPITINTTYYTSDFVWDTQARRMYGGPKGSGWADGINNVIGGFGAGMGRLNGTFRLSNNSGFSFKYYASKWGGGSRGNIATYNAMKCGKLIGKGSAVIGVAISAYNIKVGYNADGGEYGYNAQIATGEAVGGTIGSYGGAETGAVVGASIGVWFGAVGAVPGAIIGGIIGGALGGWGGSALGGSVVESNY